MMTSLRMMIAPPKIEMMMMTSVLLISLLMLSHFC